MQKGIDLKVRRKPELGGIYDLSIVDGEFELVNNFDTSLQMSVYCERRADSSEVLKPEYRRGWWGNELTNFVGFEIGSKLWLLRQARLDQITINKITTYAYEGLQWLVDQGHLVKVEVETIVDSYADGSVRLLIRLFRSPDEIETRFFDLWNNTESFEERSL
jgi:phage gp46-like protein